MDFELQKRDTLTPEAQEWLGHEPASTLGTAQSDLLKSGGFSEFFVETSGPKISKSHEDRLAGVVFNHRQRLIDIMESVPGVVWEAWGLPNAASQRINFVSRFVEKMLGYTVSEWLGQPNFWLSVVHPEDRERASREAHQIFQSKKGGVSQFRWVTKQGVAIWVEAHSIVICDPDGNPLGMRGVTMDITERKRREIHATFLSEAGALLNASLDYKENLQKIASLSTPLMADWCAINLLQPNGNIQLVALSHPDPVLLERCFQYRRSHVSENIDLLAQAIHRGEAIHRNQITVEQVREHALDETHFELIRDLGMHSLIIVPLKAREKIIGSISLVMGESKREFSELDLRIAENLARRMALSVENAQLYEQVTQSRHDLELLNDLGKSITAELNLDKLLQKITDLSLPLTGAEFAAFFYTEKVTEEVSFKLHTLSGSSWDFFERFQLPRVLMEGLSQRQISREADLWKRMESRKEPIHSLVRIRSYLAVPVISRNNELIGCLFVGHSRPHAFAERAEHLMLGITLQAAIAIDNARLFATAQAAQAHAEAASRAKDHFIAALSHELRTPLTPVMMMVGLLHKRPNLDRQIKSGLDLIERNIALEAKLIDDLLDFNRITHNKIELNITTVAMHIVLQRALEICKTDFTQKSIRVVQHLAASEDVIHGDDGRLQQVLWNLLKNAAKFTGKEGEVVIHTTNENGQFILSVEDNGIGIAPDKLESIFEPFEQGHGEISKKYGGLGLGLAISRSTVEAHGGTLRAESLGEGAGARFILSLKLHSERKISGVKPLTPPVRRKRLPRSHRK